MAKETETMLVWQLDTEPRTKAVFAALYEDATPLFRKSFGNRPGATKDARAFIERATKAARPFGLGV